MKFITVMSVFICTVFFAATAWSGNGNDPSAQTLEMNRVRLLLQVGLASGGEKIFEGDLYYEDGDSERVDVKAGDGYSLGLGLIMPLSASGKAEIQVAGGWKEKRISAENGDVTFNRIPIDVMVLARFKRMRIGGGITYHLNPKMAGDGFVGEVDVEFDNALGYLLEADYVFAKRWILGLRGTLLEYEKESVAINGNSTEIVLGVWF